MRSADLAGTNCIEKITKNGSDETRVKVTPDWMPRSGYGPYCTIPTFPEISDSILERSGLQSFSATRSDIASLANDYMDRACALAAKAKLERMLLSQSIRGVDDERLIRPYRMGLRVTRRANYLYLSWRKAVKVRGRWIRYEAPTWDCRSRLDVLVENTHPAEEHLIRQIEAEATEIRLRWFALVRLVHYMNVTEKHRLIDMELGLVHSAGNESDSVARRLLRRFLTFLAPKS